LLPNNLISDVEKAVATRSSEIVPMLRRITDLFLVNAGHYSADQLELYDGILKTLIDKVEIAARAELARRLALIDGAPRNTIRLLALDEAIEVAEPVLAQSNDLDDDTLVNCIAINGQKHLFAIATRNKVSETVSDQLVEKGNKIVLGALARNLGAAISDKGFGTLVQKSTGDDWLSECVAIRIDIPEHHFRQLISRASDVVRHRLKTSNPSLGKIIDEILPFNVTSIENITPDASIDYQMADRVVKSRGLSEMTVREFAQEKKTAEIVVSIAQLSGLSTTEIGRLFFDTWSSPVAVILKAIGFHLATLDAIYHSQLSSGEASRNDLEQTKAEFVALRRSTAERILRFYRTRRSAEFPELSGDTTWN